MKLKINDGVMELVLSATVESDIDNLVSIMKTTQHREPIQLLFNINKKREDYTFTSDMIPDSEWCFKYETFKDETPKRSLNGLSDINVLTESFNNDKGILYDVLELVNAVDGYILEFFLRDDLFKKNITKTVNDIFFDNKSRYYYPNEAGIRNFKYNISSIIKTIIQQILKLYNIENTELEQLLLDKYVAIRVNLK